jgi:predicted N-acetyltransferase YhbS
MSAGGINMAQYRKAKPEESQDLISLANLAFERDMERLVSKVYRSEFDPASITWVADKQGELVGQTAVLPQALNVLGKRLNVGFVGTVSVHPDHRGEGHMKALMNASIEEMRQNFDLGVLSGRRQRYEHFGFTPGGVTHKYTINQMNVRDANTKQENYGFAPLFEQEGALNFALAMNKKRIVNIQRSADLLPDILSNFGRQSIAILKNGKLTGYLIANDKWDEISEIEIECEIENECNQELLSILKAYLLSNGLESVAIRAPEYDIHLNSALSGVAEGMSIETPEKFLIFDFPKVVEAYLKLKQAISGLSWGEFSAVIDGAPIFIKVDKDGVYVEPTATQNAHSLGRQEAQMLFLTSCAKWASIKVPQDWFPLPLYWHTADLF